MKNRKIRRLKFFGIIDIAAMAEYLESMAQKGYFFTGCTGLFYTFEKGVPEKRRYHIELFHDGSMFGSEGDNEETRAYAAQWEAKGWKYIYANGRQIFFVAEAMDAEPVNAEPKEQWKTVKKCIKGELTAALIWMLLCIWNIFSFDDAWPTEFIEYGTPDLFWVAILAFWTGNFLRGFLFYFKNRRHVAKGEMIVFPKGPHETCFRIIITTLLLTALVLLLVSLCLESKEISVFVLISLVIIAVIVYFGIKLLRGIGSRKTKAQQIIILVVLAIMACAVATVVAFIAMSFDDGDRTIEYRDEYGNTVTESVSDDELLLTQKDIGIDTSKLIQADTVCDRYVTIYGTVMDCWQLYYDKSGEIATDLTYNIADCRFGWVKDRLLENYMTKDDDGSSSGFRDISSKEAALWDAEQVYVATPEDGGYTRLVVYEDVIIFITNSETDYTEAVIGRIIDSLADELK